MLHLYFCQRRIVQELVSELAKTKYYRNSAEAKKEIAVLSQYRAQCSAIEKELKEKGYDECTVRTVVASQGQLNMKLKLKLMN